MNGRSSPPKSSVFPCEISDSVGRHDLSFDGSENTNLFVEELLHKTETEHPFLVSQPNTREIHLLTARRRLSLGATCDSADARRRATPRSILFPPVFPAPQNRTSESNAYNAVRALAPKDQAKEWWKMLYGDDKPQCHVRSMIPRSAPSKSWYVQFLF